MCEHIYHAYGQLCIWEHLRRYFDSIGTVNDIPVLHPEANMSQTQNSTMHHTSCRVGAHLEHASAARAGSGTAREWQVNTRLLYAPERMKHFERHESYIVLMIPCSRRERRTRSTRCTSSRVCIHCAHMKAPNDKRKR